jgi:hypothetical protein
MAVGMLWWMGIQWLVTRYGRAYRIFGGDNVSPEKSGTEQANVTEA